MGLLSEVFGFVSISIISQGYPPFAISFLSDRTSVNETLVDLYKKENNTLTILKDDDKIKTKNDRKVVIM